MRAVVVDFPEYELEERRRKGLDVFDEVWDGVLHMVPAPSYEHQRIGTELLIVLAPLAKARGLVPLYESNLFRPGSEERDYRVPDLVFSRPENVDHFGIAGRAELAVEILSPGDETYDKIDFYAEVGVQELLMVDLDTRGVELFVLRGGRLHAALADPSGSIALTAVGVTLATIDGPKLQVSWDGGEVEI